MDIIFPLKELASFSDNIYEITVAASRRAYQMSKIGDPAIGDNAGKAVSVAAKQLFSGDISYRIEDSSRK